MKTIWRLAVLAPLWAAMAACGATPLVLSVGTGATVRTDGGFTIGYQFQVGARDLPVDDLGVWDGANGSTNGDGLLSSHAVGLWLMSTNNPNAGTLVASATVPAGTAGSLVGDFRYSSLTGTVTLLAGRTYRLGGYYGATSGEPFVDESAVAVATFNAGATNYFGYYAAGASLSMPVSGPTSSSESGYLGPNLIIVPEPTTALLLGAGCLWLLRRRH